MRKKVTIWTIIVVVVLAIEGLALYIIGIKELFVDSYPFRCTSKTNGKTLNTTHY